MATTPLIASFFCAIDASVVSQDSSDRIKLVVSLESIVSVRESSKNAFHWFSGYSGDSGVVDTCFRGANTVVHCEAKHCREYDGSLTHLGKYVSTTLGCNNRSSRSGRSVIQQGELLHSLGTLPHELSWSLVTNQAQYFCQGQAQDLYQVRSMQVLSYECCDWELMYESSTLTLVPVRMLPMERTCVNKRGKSWHVSVCRG